MGKHSIAALLVTNKACERTFGGRANVHTYIHIGAEESCYFQFESTGVTMIPDLNDEDIEIASQKFEQRATEGFIKPDDVEHLLRDCGVVIQKFVLLERLKEQEKAFATNNNLCDLDTFVTIYKRTYAEQPDDEVLINAIKSLTPPGEQGVPAALMREILMTYGDKLTPDEADEFIADCDEFGTGELEPETTAGVLINGPK